MMGRLMVRYGRSVGTVFLTLIAVVFVMLLLPDLAQAQATNVQKAGPAEVLVGQDFTYTITATNDGIVGVTVADTLPLGVDLNGPLPAGCNSTEAGNIVTVTCNLTTVAAGAPVTLALNVEAPNNGGQITNQATVDGVSSNVVTTDVVPSADIQIVKEANPNPVDLGDNLTFTLNVINRGPSNAPFVRIRDDLPGNVILISVDENEGDDCTVRPGQIIECDFTNLASGEGRSVLVTVEPEEAGTVKNTARVIRGTIGVVDPNAANNVDTVTVTVEADPDPTPDPNPTPDPTPNPDPGDNSDNNGNSGNGTDEDNGSDTVVISGDNNDVDQGTIPNKPLPDTGGANAGILVGAGLLVLFVGFLTWISRFRSL